MTGDADLQVLRSYADIGIVSPRQFLAWLEQSRGLFHQFHESRFRGLRLRDGRIVRRDVSVIYD